MNTLQMEPTLRTVSPSRKSLLCFAQFRLHSSAPRHWFPCLMRGLVSQWCPLVFYCRWRWAPVPLKTINEQSSQNPTSYIYIFFIIYHLMSLINMIYIMGSPTLFPLWATFRHAKQLRVTHASQYLSIQLIVQDHFLWSFFYCFARRGN